MCQNQEDCICREGKMNKNCLLQIPPTVQEHAQEVDCRYREKRLNGFLTGVMGAVLTNRLVVLITLSCGCSREVKSIPSAM